VKRRLSTPQGLEHHDGPLRLATRGSALALAQTAIVAGKLEAAGAAGTEVVVIRTRGDREASTPAAQMEGMGWFTAELEAALVDGRADAAVHSAKDLPTELALGAAATVVIVDRGDVRDALVTRDALRLDELAAGSTVGTSSLRREAFLAALRPDLRVVALRGNVDTRLRKLDEGEVDALLLAAAGLDRLGHGDRASVRLPEHEFVPAPAQGAIAVEFTTSPELAARAALAAVADERARRLVDAERAVLAALGGGCRVPLGASAVLEGDDLVLVGALAVDGVIRRVEMRGDPDDPRALGERVAERLRR
jgi:hydroxymethylbilane synthase